MSEARGRGDDMYAFLHGLESRWDEPVDPVEEIAQVQPGAPTRKVYVRPKLTILGTMRGTAWKGAVWSPDKHAMPDRLVDETVARPAKGSRGD
jgi:hypothetical protein